METSPAKQEQQKAKWESRLLNDLLFIKKHGRYPISKRTIIPATGLLLFALLMARLAWPMIFLSEKATIVPIVVAVVALLGIVNVTFLYWNMLRFKKLLTHFHLQKNIKLLKQFFQLQQLAFTQHPEAPEVFMIMSRALGGQDDHREVMIFIADDERILVNSHFIDQKFTITYSSRSARHMTRMLQNWIIEHIKNNNSGEQGISKM